MSDKLPVSKPSQWACRTKLEADTMRAWVNTELDHMYAIRDNFLRFGTMHEEDKWRSDGETPDWAIVMMVVAEAIKQADDKGDIEPLRKDLLHLTGHDLSRFLKRPKQKRGGKFSKDDSNDRAKKATTDVGFINALWRREFPGHQRRPKGDRVTAASIAAERNGIDIVAVLSKRKNPSRK
jgi:hypothetical protein